ncbi:MAG: cytochrome c biogenesis protein CcsA [Spirochaetes bacterium]|nr:cytochrome c biogenesis protein CcsA [Spirochaetota bacterium]
MATLAFLLLIVSALLQSIALFKRKTPSPSPSSETALPRRSFTKRPLTPSLFLLLAGFLLLLHLGVRSYQIRFIALTGVFESLVFYSGFLCFLLFVYPLQSRLPFLPFIQFGGTIVAIVLLALASSPIAPKEALPPIPALRSYWLVLHVAFSFIGEAFFVVSFVSALSLVLSKEAKRKEILDRITYTSIAVGYPIFTAGALIFGAVWAEKAWGRYWNWDPKETWALITWLVYTVYLHLRLLRGKKDSITTWIAILGFLCTLFTFFGVNYLLSGLHSYR